ncbi:kanamycin kinase [Sediminihabitans luteus]|uniref:Kanamycin kinase n=1 Tax=Sediminihabitans luteus TaxID=1138585 RepID=A0A2M9CPF0_9CELL|nr:aminoglycoside 3'-phosphotransferase [Sediminihabitans luteus]PJJ73777.1 kanamycin kinase [Sediminihabitans luteus]GIJ00546.1 putative phosphotransferase [Sediminihabitans luteus]
MTSDLPTRPPFASAPRTPVPLPDPLAEVLRSCDVDPAGATAVWRNGLGGLTFRVEGHHLKWSPDLAGVDLDDEAQRLVWAGRWTPVPRVVRHGRVEAVPGITLPAPAASLPGSDGGTWLLTETIPGRSAVEPRWSAAPDVAARAVGAGLRALHDALPLLDCPYSWAAPQRAANARDRIDAGDGPDSWHPEHRDLTPADVLARLADVPDPDLVVCHGDACAPNTLLHDDGSWAAHVDLGALGVADRWADLAVAAWSTEWNYGPGYEHLVYDAYGIAPDPAKIAYYRLLWDVS